MKRSRIIIISSFVILLLFCSSLLSKQDSFRNEIENTAKEYFKLLNKSDYENSMNYIHPMLFDVISREIFLMSLEQMKQDTIVNISFDEFKIHSIATPITISNVKYSVVQYSYKLKMVMTTQDLNSEGMLIDITRSALAGQFGDENVDYDKSQSVFNINLLKTMFAISSPTYAGWKFIEYDSDLRPYLTDIIPQEIWSAFDRKIETTK